MCVSVCNSVYVFFALCLTVLHTDFFLCPRGMTALDLARLRRGVAEVESQERFDAITTLLIRFTEAPTNFAINERVQPNRQTDEGGFLASVGTFFFGRQEMLPQLL